MEKDILESSQLISYVDYIEESLYKENNGYYMNDQEKIGKYGDYYTTPTLSFVFAEVIADYFRQLVNRQEIQPVFYEIGSGNGAFAKSFLHYMSSIDRELYEKMMYISIERSPYHIQYQKKSIDSNRIQFYSNLQDLKVFNGLIFSNEWFDALPVYIVEKKNYKLYEVMLQFENNSYREVHIPLENYQIISYLKQFPKLEIQNGQRVEIPYAMLKYYEDLIGKLVKGIIMTVDYGYTFSELKLPHLLSGTLRGYKNHQQINDVLNVPHVDITYHIHFEALMEVGEKLGCETVEFVRQDEFLLRHNILNKLVNHVETNPFSKSHKYNRAIRSLLDPTGISSSFHVLVQKR